MLPAFYIIKNTVNKPDQSGSTVVKTLFQTEGSGFTAADGFELKMWERPIDLPTKKRKGAGDDAPKVWSPKPISHRQLAPVACESCDCKPAELHLA